jgi:hypothetical protein
MFFPHRRKRPTTLPDDFCKRKNIEFEGKLYSANDILEMAVKNPQELLRLENSKKLKATNSISTVVLTFFKDYSLRCKSFFKRNSR